ncbi:hypothetical protein TVAG_257480 [Trichomonas vaginalis G3]|uniref:Uncharacterized protein n=1 Tax=Trichomonas vaginalis (strain ATCC PRA-98 / G3) TaxID=412133 RepID=A2ELI2_TRIV3|nr:hypothetical protein TVAGG3_0005080 [Trichomonas vaginalis G3]EAY06509.1 hypothetical protein TVAG_257480 [Trichomonas vaginalis G3]KAI5538855.1 hypothetical protein TVAGG3_0005080 [Trichomonas vaginalis G3]|eukprot:XP_001318732.1 hypothetical protein [Trichomonas vaginalis G3]
MLTQTIIDPLAGIGETNFLGTGRRSTISYIPYSTKKKEEKTDVKERSTKTPIPVAKTQRSKSSFQSTKNAFISSRAHQKNFAQTIIDRNWEKQDKIRRWNYTLQIQKIEANIQVRKDHRKLGDLTQKKLKIYGDTLSSTGPVQHIKLPRDVQVTEYTPSHIHYF